LDTTDQGKHKTSSSLFSRYSRNPFLKKIEEEKNKYKRGIKKRTKKIDRKLKICHKLHLAITPWILAHFPQSKMCLEAFKKTFQMMPKMCQSN